MGREPKTTKGTMERKVRPAWHLLQKGKQYLTDEHIRVLAAFAMTLQYYEERDNEDGTNHADSFKRIYLEKDVGYLKRLTSGKLLDMLRVEIVISGGGKTVRTIGSVNSEFAQDAVKLKIKPKDITPKKTKEAHGNSLGKSRSSVSRHTGKYIIKFKSAHVSLRLE